MIRSLIRRVIPEEVKGTIDYYRFPHLLDGFGGPFNGQCGRQLLFHDLLRNVEFSHVLETGAFRGTTTEFFARESGLPVYSVELHPRLRGFAVRRLKRFKNVKVSPGDSRQFLRTAMLLPTTRTRFPFVYLDAHWYADLPLAEEVQIIAEAYAQYVIMVDDFQVPDDPGYGYDQYSDGRALSIDYLRETILRHRLGIGYPSLPSSRESGHRRGCIVIFPDEIRGILARVPSLRLSSVERKMPSFASNDEASAEY